MKVNKINTSLSKDEIVEEILKQMPKYGGYIPISQFVGEGNKELINSLSKYMNHHGIAESHVSHKNSIQLTSFGITLSENEGWVNYLNKEKTKKNCEEKRAEVAYRVNKQKLFSYPITVIISVLGFLMGLIAFLNEIGIINIANLLK